MNSLVLLNSRETRDERKRNSAIYAYFLLASLVAFMWIGLILVCLIGTLMIAAGKEEAVF